MNQNSLNLKEKETESELSSRRQKEQIKYASEIMTGAES